MDDREIPEILARLRAGDRDARDALFEYVAGRFRPLAHKLLRVDFPRVGLYAETNDILHETLCKLIPYLERADVAACSSAEQFYGLSALVIRRTLLDLARRFFGKFKTHQIDEGLENAHSDLRESSGMSVWRERYRVHELIEQLSPERRQVLEMKLYLGLSVSETAERLGVHPGTVSRRMTAAKEALGRLIREDDRKAETR